MNKSLLMGLIVLFVLILVILIISLVFISLIYTHTMNLKSSISLSLSPSTIYSTTGTVTAIEYPENGSKCPLGAHFELIKNGDDPSTWTYNLECYDDYYFNSWESGNWNVAEGTIFYGSRTRVSFVENYLIGNDIKKRIVINGGEGYPTHIQKLSTGWKIFGFTKDFLESLPYNMLLSNGIDFWFLGDYNVWLDLYPFEFTTGYTNQPFSYQNSTYSLTFPYVATSNTENETAANTQSINGYVAFYRKEGISYSFCRYNLASNLYLKVNASKEVSVYGFSQGTMDWLMANNFVHKDGTIYKVTRDAWATFFD